MIATPSTSNGSPSSCNTAGFMRARASPGNKLRSSKTNASRAGSSGAAINATLTWVEMPSRNRVTIASRPRPVTLIRYIISAGVCTSLPFTAVMTSPTANPAAANGLALCIPETMIPPGRSKPNGAAISASTGWPLIPAQGRTNRSAPARACSKNADIKLAGIAKPIPLDPPDLVKIEVLIPINVPCMSISAPPEFPGLMGASVWMKYP